MKFDRFTKIILLLIALLLVSILVISSSKTLPAGQSNAEFISCGVNMCIYYAAKNTVYMYHGQDMVLLGSFPVPLPGGNIDFKDAK